MAVPAPEGCEHGRCEGCADQSSCSELLLVAVCLGFLHQGLDEHGSVQLILSWFVFMGIYPVPAQAVLMLG